MIIEESTVWLIMSKDRTVVAKGTPRNRELCKVEGKDKKRYLTYSSKKRAEAGFRGSGFFGTGLLKGYTRMDDLSDHLEAVECKMTLEIKENEED